MIGALMQECCGDLKKTQARATVQGLVQLVTGNSRDLGMITRRHKAGSE